MAPTRTGRSGRGRWWSTAAAAVLLQQAPGGAQPSWYAAPELSYPRGEYLIGLGIGSGGDPAERLRVAEENARGDLIRSIRTRISSEFLSETSETGAQLDAFFRSRVVSNAALEVDGVRIAERDHRGQLAYALALLPRAEGRRRHADRIARLDEEIDRLYQAAEKQERHGQTEGALKAYLGMYPVLASRDEVQAVLLALGDFAANAFRELDGAGDRATVRRSDVDGAIDRLTGGVFSRVDAAATALVFRLAQQLRPDQPLVVLPFTYGETRFASPFSRYLEQAMNHKLAGSGLRPVSVRPGFRPRTTEHNREGARQAGAELIVTGTYLPRGSSLKIFALATELEAGTKVAAAEVELDTALVVREGLDFVPQNFQRALQDAGVFGAGELVSGRLRVEAWTDRGSENIVLEENEEVTLAVRVNQACYVQLLYHLADGKRVLLYNNYYIDQANANHAVVLPDTLIVDRPFGVEVL